MAMRLIWSGSQGSLLREALGGSLMSSANENYAPERTEQDRERDALEGYYQRRLAEIAAGAPLSDHFVSVEVLQELADGLASGSGTQRSG